MLEKLHDHGLQIHILAIIIGTIVGLLSVYICIKWNLAILGFNICIIISPVIAGFVETIIAQHFTESTTGAISAIILFIVTNIFGWIILPTSLSLNIFTIGGFLMMLQAAFPLTINCILIGVLLVLVTNFGRIIGFIVRKLHLHPKENIMPLENIALKENYGILIINEGIGVDIKKYYGMIVVEDIIKFKDKSSKETIEYMEGSLEKKKLIKYKDYLKSKEFIINELKSEAKKIGANAIIDLKIEYTNYNEQLPPDMLIIAYGTAVLVDDSYVKNAKDDEQQINKDYQ